MQPAPPYGTAHDRGRIKQRQISDGAVVAVLGDRRTSYPKRAGTLIVLRHPGGRCVTVGVAKDSNPPRTSRQGSEGHMPCSESMVEKLLRATSP
jgi:hypothetical protein